MKTKGTEMIKESEIIVPFLKWAGGKRWLVSSHSDFFPEKFDRYVEPFLGSAAVFFHLRPKKAILSDVNPQLINTYKAIKKDWRKVVRILREHHNNHSKNYYYKIRESKPRTLHGAAAKFIYLNRTCWNGLYRVNLEGEFNVPIGTKTDALLNSDNFEIVSELLQSATIKCIDFQKIIDDSVKGDFLFVDPPYTVKHNLNGFVKYNEKLFSWDDQIRLHDVLIRASNRGVKFLLTNADHASVRTLYEDFENIKLNRNSVLAANANRRGITSELLVTNYG